MPELAGRGLRAEALDLPFTSRADDVATVAAAIDRLSGAGEPVVVVGHSLGGAVISAAGGSAAHLVYLTAVMADPAEPFEMGDPTPGMSAIRMDGDQSSVDPKLATVAFYHRCRPEDAEWAIARLRPMPTATLAAPMAEDPAWRRVPSTYIVCTDDQIMSPPAQRKMAAGARSVVEIDSDHSPFLYCPAELAGILAGVVGRQTAG
jgi:pimeloyl-ACP methyl ester carboxylesterase